MQVDIHDSIAEIDESAWNRLAGDAYPFLRHEFFAAAENSGCVSPDTGWTPRHLVLYGPDGKMRAAMPLYEKSHSWGEFVFDWSWAQAYQRAGIDYYPKLISAVPFTPAPSTRIMLSDPEDRNLAGLLLKSAIQLAEDIFPKCAINVFAMQPSKSDTVLRNATPLAFCLFSLCRTELGEEFVEISIALVVPVKLTVLAQLQPGLPEHR